MKLIENCRAKWWRFYSVWFSAALSTVIGVAASAPETVASVVNGLPPEWRGAFPPFLIFGLTGISVAIRIIHQPKVTGNAEPPAA